MAKMTLKRGADIDRVREELRQKGIVVSQRMPDGSYSVFVNKRRWRYLIADPKEQERMAAASDRERRYWKRVKKELLEGGTRTLEQIREKLRGLTFNV